MTTRLEMPIPRSVGETIFAWVIFVGTIGLSIKAVLNLLSGEDVVASRVWSSLWFGVVIWQLCQSIIYEGGIGTFAINRLSDLVGRHFAEITSLDDHSKEVRFGFQLLGHRFIQKCVSLDKIESVEWSPGQAKKYWNIGLWFKKADLTKRNEWAVKPDQDVCIVGPSQRKEATETLVLTFVDFLLSADVTLVRGKGDACFVRPGNNL
jgi:hypothetical protein